MGLVHHHKVQDAESIIYIIMGFHLNSICLKKSKEYSPFIWNSATLVSTKEFFLKQLSYLYFECPSGEKYITSDLNIPSQFFRGVIAKELNIENYFDWKQNFGMENIAKTINILSNPLEFI